MFGLGLPEMGIVAVVAILIFTKKIPELGNALGKTLRSFKDGISQSDDDAVDQEKDKEEEGQPKV